MHTSDGPADAQRQPYGLSGEAVPNNDPGMQICLNLQNGRSVTVVVHIFYTEWEDDSARLVVAEHAEDGTAYMLAISSEREASHAMRFSTTTPSGAEQLTFDNLSAYEMAIRAGVEFPPLEYGKSWSFTLFGIGWNTEIIDEGFNGSLFATSSDGQTLTYCMMAGGRVHRN